MVSVWSLFSHPLADESMTLANDVCLSISCLTPTTTKKRLVPKVRSSVALVPYLCVCICSCMMSSPYERA
jgi:hypothetical protein